ncbi:hypothetical protein C1J03_16435 [Sulfitobacter sp. SK012]|uniref:calcium-binding protein n=1 Tax=Sulfitobacter sp. SK012 TaxID=1389005 RepID=UPI000E0C67CD|nr:hypothetical protein [Sulfitobacter sp. SK012]AXI47454.1 hypothetical protein C1J03_16435 [Sulfitobacter sp. SK012]
MLPLMSFLLVAMSPLLAVGFDTSSDEEEEDPDAALPEDGSDPVEMVDVASFLEDARSVDGDTGPFNIVRGTDMDEDFVGTEGSSNVFDTSGGTDTIIGATGADTLIGGEDSDVITGGDGDDALFGGFQRETRVDDLDADTIDGGLGDDALFLGNGDTATGGAGADVFAAIQGADGNVIITDFDEAEDALAIETPTPDDISVTDQTVTDDGLVIGFSTGLSVTLQGLTSPLAEDTITFVSVTALDTPTTG